MQIMSEDGKEYSDMSAMAEADLQRILGEYIPEDFKSRKGVRVLSVGGGEGLDARPLQKLLPGMVEYVAVEIDRSMVDLARASHPNIPEENFRHGSFLQHDPNLWGNDLVLLRETSAGPGFGTGTSQADVRDRRFFNNARDALNKDGVMIITSTNLKVLEDITGFLVRPGGEYEYVLARRPEPITQPISTSYPGKRETSIAVIRKLVRRSS